MLENLLGTAPEGISIIHESNHLQPQSKEEAPSQGPEEALALALGEAEPGSMGLQR